MRSEIVAKQIELELAKAAEMSRNGNEKQAFNHLERAHVLGQSSTYDHTRVHCLMLKHGLRNRDAREVFGQTLRIAGAATKTPLGVYPEGNTGGANVSPLWRMPIAEDLREILNTAKK